MKQKPINEIEEEASKKTIEVFSSLTGMSEMKSIIGMIARDAARNTTLALRDEGYFFEPTPNAKPKMRSETKAEQRADDVFETMATMFDELLASGKDRPIDGEIVTQLVNFLFPKKSA